MPGVTLEACPCEHLDEIYVYQLVTPGPGFKFFAISYPRVGTRPVTVYGDTHEQVVGRVQHLLNIK